MVKSNLLHPIQKTFKNLASLGKITTGFGGQTRYESFHPAVDIASEKGTPIPTPVNGVVTSVQNGKKQGDNGFGNFVTIKDADGNTHQFNHLQQPMVVKGQNVQGGKDYVGTMGNTGSVYSPSGQGDGTHLDYRIVSAYGRYKNPMTYLKNFNT